MDKKQEMMSDDQLQRLVEEISTNEFQWTFRHKATFNKRLRTTGGRYLLKNHNIEINPKQLEYYGEEALIGIIKHELCHYHLHLQGKGFQHRDQDFRMLLTKVGAPRFCGVVPGTTNKTHITHQYECRSCGLLYSRKRRLDTQKYVCGRCRGKLKKIK